MSKKRKKHKNKNKRPKYYTYSNTFTSSSKEINLIANSVFGSLYFNPSKD